MLNVAMVLEDVCVDLVRARDLLNILQDGIFATPGEVSDYVQQYEAVADVARRLINKKEEELHEVYEMLYAIERQMKESE